MLHSEVLLPLHSRQMTILPGKYKHEEECTVTRHNSLVRDGSCDNKSMENAPDCQSRHSAVSKTHSWQLHLPVAFVVLEKGIPDLVE